MSPRKKQPAAAFPEVTCAACRFCYGERSEWECWANPPRHMDPDELGQNRGEPIDPNWPACYFFIARAQ